MQIVALLLSDSAVAALKDFLAPRSDARLLCASPIDPHMPFINQSKLTDVLPDLSDRDKNWLEQNNLSRVPDITALTMKQLWHATRRSGDLFIKIAQYMANEGLRFADGGSPEPIVKGHAIYEKRPVDNLPELGGILGHQQLALLGRNRITCIQLFMSLTEAELLDIQNVGDQTVLAQRAYRATQG